MLVVVAVFLLLVGWCRCRFLAWSLYCLDHCSLVCFVACLLMKVKKAAWKSSRKTERLQRSSASLVPLPPNKHALQQLALAATGRCPVSNDIFALQFKGKQTDNTKRVHLTPLGQMITAVRRNLCNIAAKDFGCACLTDLSSNSTIRSELIFGATRVASFRAFHETHEQDVLDSSSQIAVATHSWSNAL